MGGPGSGRPMSSVLRNKFVGVRLAPSEYNRIAAIARRSHLGTASWARLILLAAADAELMAAVPDDAVSAKRTKVCGVNLTEDEYARLVLRVKRENILRKRPITISTWAWMVLTSHKLTEVRPNEETAA